MIKRKIVFWVLNIVLFLSSTNLIYAQDSLFVDFLGHFKSIDLPYKIDIKEMKNLLNSIPKFYNKKNEFLSFTKYIKKIDSIRYSQDSILQEMIKIDSIENKDFGNFHDTSLYKFNFFIPLVKYELDENYFTIFIVISEEFGYSDKTSYSLSFYEYIFDAEGNYLDQIEVARYMNSQTKVFTIECNIELNGNINQTLKSFKTNNKVEEESKSSYKFNKEKKILENIK